MRMRLSNDGRDALVTVDNDGPPVAPEDRATASSAGSCASTTRDLPDTGGTGLGLAIVAEIVKAHGGYRRRGEPRRVVPLLGQASPARGIGLSR